MATYTINSIQLPNGDICNLQDAEANTRLDEVEASSLPVVDANDNGKILRVVNGEWVATSLINASGVEF